MIAEIYNILAVNNIDISPLPMYNDGVGYEFNILNSDKCKTQYLLKLTIINSDLLVCYETQRQINRCLLTLGDENKGLLLGVSQSGGSFLYDDKLKKYKLKATYIVVTKG